MIKEELEDYKEKTRLKFLSYDKNRHMALLKKKSLLDQFSNDSAELGSYSVFLNMQLDWVTRSQYVSLIENFLEHKTSIGEFICEFHERGLLNDDVTTILESNLILLSLHPNSFDFGYIIDEIYTAGQLFDFDSDEPDAENNFYNFVKKKFLEIQNYFNLKEKNESY
jgi:hypothetical protein